MRPGPNALVRTYKAPLKHVLQVLLKFPWAAFGWSLIPALVGQTMIPVGWFVIDDLFKALGAVERQGRTPAYCSTACLGPAALAFGEEVVLTPRSVVALRLRAVQGKRPSAGAAWRRRPWTARIRSARGPSGRPAGQSVLDGQLLLLDPLFTHRKFSSSKKGWGQANS